MGSKPKPIVTPELKIVYQETLTRTEREYADALSEIKEARKSGYPARVGLLARRAKVLELEAVFLRHKLRLTT